MLHSEGFAATAKPHEAHKLAMEVGKGMAAVGLRVLQDDDFAFNMKKDFARDQQLRHMV